MAVSELRPLQYPELREGTGPEASEVERAAHKERRGAAVGPPTITQPWLLAALSGAGRSRSSERQRERQEALPALLRLGALQLKITRVPAWLTAGPYSAPLQQDMCLL